MSPPWMLKEGTSDTSNTKCSFCKGKDPKSLTWPVEKKTMSHELSKLTMINSDASVQGDGFRESREETQQRGMRQMCCDSEAGRVTAVYRVLDMRRPTWSLRPLMDSGCDVYFAKDRCWIAQNNGKEFDVILSSGVFFVAAKLSKLLSRERETCWNPIRCHKQRSNEQRRQECMPGLESQALRRETR